MSYSGQGLTSLVSSPPLNIQCRYHDTLLQAVVDGCKGGHRAATTISGPDYPNRGGPRADRPNNPHILMCTLAAAVGGATRPVACHRRRQPVKTGRHWNKALNT